MTTDQHWRDFELANRPALYIFVLKKRIQISLFLFLPPFLPPPLTVYFNLHNLPLFSFVPKISIFPKFVCSIHQSELAVYYFCLSWRLTSRWLVSGRCSISVSPENIRKPVAFWYSRGGGDKKADAARQRFSSEKVLWKYAADLQENTHTEVWFQWSWKVTLLKSHFDMGVLL